MKDILHKDLKLKTNDDFNTIIGTANRDNKTFSGVIKSLGVLKEAPKKHPSFTPDQYKDATEKKFHRYIKNKEERVKGFEENDPVKLYTKKFIACEINSKDYSNILSKNNINPNIDDINKLIRGHDHSQGTKYQDLIFAVNRYQNLINPEPKVVKEKPKDNNAVINDCDKQRTMVVIGNTPMYLPKRKTVAGDPNFTSNKEHFDYTNLKKN